MEQYIADFEKEIRTLKLNDVLEKELIDKAFSKLSLLIFRMNCIGYYVQKG